MLPGTTFDDRLRLDVGRLRVDLLHLNIHSDDATVVFLHESGLLLAGDTLEDSVTYVNEPGDFDAHLPIWTAGTAGCERILPNHGDPE